MVCETFTILRRIRTFNKLHIVFLFNKQKDMNTWLHSNLKPLSETIYEYYNYQGSDKESDFIQELHLKIQNCLKSRDIKKKINGLQHLLFLDLIGYDTTWSDFEVLEIMEQDNISTKFVSYTVASQIWK